MLLIKSDKYSRVPETPMFSSPLKITIWFCFCMKFGSAKMKDEWKGTNLEAQLQERDCRWPCFLVQLCVWDSGENAINRQGADKEEGILLLGQVNLMKCV